MGAGSLDSLCQKPLGVTHGFRFGTKQGEVPERRQRRRPALVHQGARQRRIATLDQVAQERVIGLVRLQDHRAGAVGTSRPPGHLHDQLTETFGGAKVDAVQALGEGLGAEELIRSSAR